MLELTEIREIMSHFGISVEELSECFDTSHNENDQRFNYVLDKKYVLKVNSAHVMWDSRLNEINRLIHRYLSIGLYCPKMLMTTENQLSYHLIKENKEYVCYVEEYAKYPVLGFDAEHDRNEVIEHLGVLAARYTNVDLSDIKSMWSIIDLAPLDNEIDEKQENTDLLIKTLQQQGYDELAIQVDEYNIMLRDKIKAVFGQLPRCVYQGDLNPSNELFHDGHFVGLIDFNMSGTDVNINVFLNETNCFPEEKDFDELTVQRMIAKMNEDQSKAISVILKHYSLNDTEIHAMPYYKRLIDLFQYPNVCQMCEWLTDTKRKEKCAELIKTLIVMPLC